MSCGEPPSIGTRASVDSSRCWMKYTHWLSREHTPWESNVPRLSCFRFPPGRSILQTLFCASPPGKPRSNTRCWPSAQALGFPAGLPSGVTMVVFEPFAGSMRFRIPSWSPTRNPSFVQVKFVSGIEGARLRPCSLVPEVGMAKIFHRFSPNTAAASFPFAATPGW